MRHGSHHELPVESFPYLTGEIDSVNSFQAEAQVIVPGILLHPNGQASVSKAAGKALFSLALELEPRVPFPVDIQHVLAAIIMASQKGEIEKNCSLEVDSTELIQVLERHVTTLFKQHGGQICPEDL